MERPPGSPSPDPPLGAVDPSVNSASPAPSAVPSPRSPTTPRPIIAISSGDPLGIGPEIIVKALADRATRSLARFHVFGVERVLAAAAHRAGIEPFWWRVRHDSPIVDTALIHDVVVRDFPEFDRFDDEAFLHPDHSKLGGEASYRFVGEAIAAAQLSADNPARAAAIVTAPISKTSWDLAGHNRFPGHTELLASRFRSKRSAMMFVGPVLKVVLVTVHVPLASVPSLLSIGRVVDAIELGHEACVRLAGGVGAPRIAVCGVNPHAGEGGILGDEDMRVITPAIKVAQSHGVDARGPFPADTIFLSAAKGDYDLVVAMYHDQGLIPVKLLDRDRAVNVTVGLGSSVRTSPAHGTAFDIAGRNKANPASMRAAIEQAVRSCTPISA